MGKNKDRIVNHEKDSMAASKKGKSEDNFDDLLKKLELGTQKKEPQATALTKQEAKARRKKKAQQLREAKVENLSDDEILKKLEQQRQQAQLQQILRLLQQQQSNGPSEILDAPVLRKHPHEAFADERVNGAVCGMQGWRSNMEDDHCIALDLCAASNPKANEKHRMFAVFDGHAGAKTSRYLATALSDEISTKEVFTTPSKHSAEEYTTALQEAFLAVDRNIRDGKHDSGSGSTACTCIITPDNLLLCVNVGDSRAVLCRPEDEVLELSFDHKPNLPKEQERIIAAGGHVSMNRVNGQLAMSRAMGDFTYKQKQDLDDTKQQVIALPDVTITQISKSDRFIILACDGVWDVLSNAAAVKFVSERLKEGLQAKEIVSQLVSRCCCDPATNGHGPSHSLGTDNITAILILL